jgi:hypothetical protein
MSSRTFLVLISLIVTLKYHRISIDSFYSYHFSQSYGLGIKSTRRLSIKNHSFIYDSTTSHISLWSSFSEIAYSSMSTKSGQPSFSRRDLQTEKVSNEKKPPSQYPRGWFGNNAFQKKSSPKISLSQKLSSPILAPCRKAE